MGDAEQVLKAVGEWLAQGRKVCLATIVSREGSAPREVGAKMAIRDDGLTAGSVGGGGLEQTITAKARQVLEAGQASIIDFDLSGKSPNLDALCGGKVSVFMEPLGEARRLFVFGAGHVGRAVSRAAALVGFSVILVDDRMDYLGREGLPESVSPVQASPGDLGSKLQVDESAFVVVATRGHSLDKDWLRAIAASRPRYVGMLGSREKAKAVRSELEGQGVARAFLETLRTPVGLAIEAVTPEEIAVSIVGELILEWRKGKGGKA
jgi:xanthine dehydrogenase accessory factor